MPAMSLVTKAQGIRRQSAAKTSVVLPSDIRELTGYRPRPLQSEIERRERRFNSVVVHRRFGKTVMKVNKLIERAVECPFPNGRYAYFAPTYGMAEDIAWSYLVAFTSRIPGRTLRESRLEVMLPTRSGHRARVRLYGCDNPKQRVRGLYLDGAVFDEWAHIPRAVWAEQVRPMLSDAERAGYDGRMDRNQWADFIFTPFGRNHAYRMHADAATWASGRPVVVKRDGVERQVFSSEWAAFLYRASETGIIAPEELDSALRDMGDAKYDQEYECSFDAAVEGAIFGPWLKRLRDRGRIGNVPYEPSLPVHTAWDLGHDDATAIWFVQQAGRTDTRVIDYLEASGEDLRYYVERLAAKPYAYGRHFLPADVNVTELGSGKSRKSILADLGLRASVVASNDKEDMIAAARRLLPDCWFDGSQCQDGLDRLALYRREKDEKHQVFRNTPLHDWASHAADAFQVLALGLRRYAADGDDPSLEHRAEM